MKTAIAVSLILAGGVAHADTLTQLQFPVPPAGIKVTSVREQPQIFVDDNFVGEVVFIGPRAVGRYVQSRYWKYAAQWAVDGTPTLGALICYQPEYLGVPKVCPQPNYTGGTAVAIGNTWYHIDNVNYLGQELLNNVFTGYFWGP